VKLDGSSAKLVLGSPSTSPETLTDIARDFPDLQAQVAAHPAATPELLDWLSQYGTPEAQSAAVTRRTAATSTAAPPPDMPFAPALANPGPPADTPPSNHRARNIVLVVAILAAVALVTWLLTGWPHRTPSIGASTPPASTEPTTHAGQWAGLSVAFGSFNSDATMGPTRIIDAGNGLVAVTNQYTTDQGECDFTIEAVNAATGKGNWGWVMTCDAIGNADVVAGNGMIAAVSGNGGGDGDQLQMIDASTGNDMGTTPFPTDGYLIGLVGDVLLAGDGASITARSTSDLETVIWQADRMLPSDAMNPLFGGGRWIHTNSGVLEVATGQPASFGADDATMSPDGTSYVYYDGPNENDILRHACSKAGCNVLIWDPVKDTSRATLMGATADIAPDLVCTDPASSYFVTVTSDLSSGTATHMAYSWQTGQSLGGTGWGTSSSAIACGWFAGSSYLVQNPADYGISVFDTKTHGSVIDSTPILATNLATNQGIAYLVSGTTMTAYDGNNGFAQLWSMQVPVAGVQLQSVAGHLFAIDAPSGRAWVLSGQ